VYRHATISHQPRQGVGSLVPSGGERPEIGKPNKILIRENRRCLIWVRKQ
jgi:hypothetical protein